MIDTPTTRSGRSDNPLADWTNDDLMIEEEVRKKVAAAAPLAFRVLDFPKLRETFVAHNKLANEAKRKLNRHGLAGARLSAIGASVLAVVPLFPAGLAQTGTVLGGVALIVVGALIGLWHLRGHSGRVTWLVQRIYTERLRQFHFQYLINTLETAEAAMRDDKALAQYLSRRDGALDVCLDFLRDNIAANGPRDAVRWLAEDHDDALIWADSRWTENSVPNDKPMSEELEELFSCLWRSRIGIQAIYAEKNLKPGTASQGDMARRILRNGNIATLVFVVSLIMAGGFVLDGRDLQKMLSDAAIAVSGIAAAWGLYFRLVDQGMGYSLDRERYQLYLEQIKKVRDRYDTAGRAVHAKICELRKLELHTYRETRQFLGTHLNSRFLG